MDAANPFAQALLNSDEAVRLSKEWTAAYEERGRLRQRVADLVSAQAELVAAETALQAKSLEAAQYLLSLASSPALVTGDRVFSGSGQPLVVYNSVTAGGGPFAAQSSRYIKLSLTGLTTAVSTTSAAITVNTTACRSTSNVTGRIVTYAGTYGPAGNGNPILVQITPGSGSFTFKIYNQDLTAALSGAIGLQFEVQD